MKVSICITVLNEERSIKKLLESLLGQTKKPDEIVIVDGGSTDNTTNIILKYFPEVKLIKRKNLSRSKGRNLAVKNAKYSIIAMTDADCICDKHWLERILSPFEGSRVTDISAGFYKMVVNTDFQKALAPFLGVTGEKFSKNFLPSTRSIAFRKSLWKKIGGFPEDENKNTSEDTIFNYKAVLNKAKIVRVKTAIVYWEVPGNLSSAIKKFFNYAMWDAKSGIWWHPVQKLKTHNIKVMTIFLRYILFIFFWPSFTFYLSWSIFKHRNFINKWQQSLYTAIIQVVSDFSVMAGFIWGILNK